MEKIHIPALRRLLRLRRTMQFVHIRFAAPAALSGPGAIILSIIRYDTFSRFTEPFISSSGLKYSYGLLSGA